MQSEVASTQPAARVEHWQKREAAINAYLRESKDLSAIKLLFVGDSITDFWLFDNNPWVSGQSQIVQLGIMSQCQGPRRPVFTAWLTNRN